MTGEQEETVLSQEEKQQTQQAEPQPEGAPEERKHNFENATRRIMTKSMRNRIAELSNGLTEDEIQNVVKSTMSTLGVDPEDRDNESQAKMFAKMQANIESYRVNKIRNARSENAKQASTLLTGTLKELGYDPHSNEGRMIGQHLFNRYDVDDPDIFRDKSLVEQEIGELTNKLSRGKQQNPVTQAAINKAGVPQGTSQSRSPSQEQQRTSDDSAYANRYGVSKNKAAKLRQLSDKLPAWMK